MTHRALLYVLLRRLKNALFRLRERPGRLIAILLLVGLFVMTVVLGRTATDPTAGSRLPVLVSLLALYLMLSLFGGLGEPGPILPPSDIDFVLPGPFSRRHILAYHLMRNYAQMILLGLFYAMFLGAAETPNPVLAYVGVVLCLVVATHLQTGMTMLTASVSERVFGRLRLVSRLILVAVLAVAAVLAIAGLAGAGDVSGALRVMMTSTVARVIFYPAVAVGELALAPTFGAALTALLGLVGCVVGTFWLVLLFPVNFVETAATRLERKQRLGSKTPARRKGTAPARNLLVTGAGAVTWLNALTLRRRLRMVVGVVIMLLFVMLFAGVRSAQDGRGDLPPVLFLLAVFPLLAHMPLGFKGHRDHLETFKTLPVHPTRLAFAEVLVPALVLWILQSTIVAVLVVAGRVEPVWLGAALAVYPVLDLGMIALSDLFQLGRDPRQLGFFLATLQMLAMTATVVPAVVVGAVVYTLTENPVDAGAAGLVAHLGVDALLLYLLGRRFRAWEPTQGP
jgi:hypothetical protein